MAQQTDADEGRTATELTEGDEVAVTYESVYAQAGNEQEVTLTITDTSWTTAAYGKDDEGVAYKLVIDGGSAVELKKADKDGNYRRVGHPESVQRLATDGGQAQEERPALLVTDEQEAAESLTIEMNRDEMRDACRDWGVSGYGDATKAEMGQLMMAQAAEAAVGSLVEAGYDIQGDLAEEHGLAEDDEDEDEEQEDEESEDRQTVQDVLTRDPDEHYNESDLTGTEKQVAALKAALDNPHLTEDEAAEIAGCTGRYVYDACARWGGSEDDQAIILEETEADRVPEWAQEVAA